MLLAAWFSLWVLMNNPFPMDEKVRRILYIVILVVLIVLLLAGPPALLGRRL